MNEKTQEVYYSSLSYHNWRLHLAATHVGLCCITLSNETFDTLIHWVNTHIPNALMIENEEVMEVYRKQLLEYLQGQRKTFTFPLDFRGTAFQISVWQALTQIPYGETRSYSEIALVVERPKAVRAVGAANGSNPIPIVVPCHRVVGKDGALRGFRGGLGIKADLLRIEGNNETLALQ